MWNKGNPHTLLIGMQTGAATVKKKKKERKKTTTTTTKTVQRFLKKLKIELPYDPAIPLLDIYYKK